MATLHGGQTQSWPRDREPERRAPRSAAVLGCPTSSSQGLLGGFLSPWLIKGRLFQITLCCWLRLIIEVSNTWLKCEGDIGVGLLVFPLNNTNLLSNSDLFNSFNVCLFLGIKLSLFTIASVFYPLHSKILS